MSTGQSKKYFVQIGKNYFFILLCLLIFLLPIFEYPLSIPYEVPKVIFLVGIIQILVILTLIFLTAKIHIAKFKIYNNLAVLLLIFFTSGIISSLFGSDINKSIWGNYFRLDGLVVYAHLLLLSFMIAIFWQIKESTKIIFTVAVNAIILALSSIYIVSNHLFSSSLSSDFWNGAIGLSFGNPNLLAGYLVLSLPFVSGAINSINRQTRLYKVVKLVSITLVVVAIILTKSWGGILGVSVWIFLEMFLKLKLYNNKKIIRIRICLSAALILFFFILTLFIKFHYQELIKSPESRLRIFKNLFYSITNRPLLGFGWANADKAFIWGQKSIEGDRNLDIYVDKAHATILEVLVTTGTLGLFIYLLVLFTIVKISYLNTVHHSSKKQNTWNKIAFITIVLYIFQSQTNITSIATETLFYMVVGAVMNKKQEKYGNIYPAP